LYEKGFREGEQTILRLLIEQRFGAMPVWVDEKLTALPVSGLEHVNERLLDAKSLEELLR